MVSSKINNQINYDENKSIDPEDMGFHSTLYELDIFDKTIIIAIGKKKFTYTSKGVIYFPIYMVENDIIKSKIGLYEIDVDGAINVMDEDGDVDLSRFDEPILFSFVTPTFIKKYKDVSDSMNRDSMNRDSETPIYERDESDDEDDVMKLKIKPSEKSKEKEELEKIVEKGIFEIDTHMKSPQLLKEETLEDSNANKLEFKKSSKNEWIENFMKNNYYNIIDNEGAGDCFFAVIRDAFKQIGQTTTVAKLRKLLASALTDNIYQEHRKLYLEFQSEIQDYEDEIDDLKKTNIEFKKRIKKVEDKREREKILEDAKKVKEQFEKIKEKRKETIDLQKEYVGYMNNIDTFDKFRDYIQTSDFWADAWAISTLERLLNVKCIIMSEESFEAGELDGVLNCGDFNKELEDKGSFSPDFYIIISYTGNHYTLITYKQKRIFTFKEIPYDIKILVLNKCLEKNSGSYYIIPDFRNFKVKLGIDPEEGKPSDIDETEYSDLYDPSIVFIFQAKSINKKAPGSGSGEKIPKHKIKDFVTLSKNDNWRRKIDDTWENIVFELENRKWKSVEHYVQGSKFKKGFPDFYALFSLDSDSEIANNVKLAIAAGDSGKIKKKSLRPKEVKIDGDYFLGRDQEERELALRAKFTQNEDFKQLLLSTNNATLMHFRRRSEAEPDLLLMKIRRELQ